MFKLLFCFSAGVLFKNNNRLHTIIGNFKVILKILIILALLAICINSIITLNPTMNFTTCFIKLQYLLNVLSAYGVLITSFLLKMPGTHNLKQYSNL